MDRFRFEKHIDESALNKPILKFLIQPLVENAIYHGLEKKRSGGTVSLKVEMMDDVIRIIVKDDGVGMAPEKLEDIRNRMTKTSKDYLNRLEYASIGLENVNYRLKDYYGPEYALNINSVEGVYTEVSFQIPYTED